MTAQTVSRLLKCAPDRRGDDGRKKKEKANINNNWRLNSVVLSTLISLIEMFLLKFLFTYRYICTTMFQVNILPVNKVKKKTLAWYVHYRNN